MFDPMTREYPALSAVATQIDIVSGVDTYDFPKNTQLEDVHIIGVFIRKPDGSNKRKTSKGKVPCNYNALLAGFINIKRSGVDTVQDLPLEFLIWDSSVNAAGEYLQLHIPKDWDQESSKIVFKTPGDLVAGEQLEFYFLTIPKNACLTNY